MTTNAVVPPLNFANLYLGRVNGVDDTQIKVMTAPTGPTVFHSSLADAKRAAELASRGDDVAAHGVFELNGRFVTRALDAVYREAEPGGNWGPWRREGFSMPERYAGDKFFSFRPYRKGDTAQSLRAVIDGNVVYTVAAPS